MDILANYREFVNIAEQALMFLDSPGEWETKFDIVFNIVSPEIKRLGITIEWLDMDTSYEEDVRNYLTGVRRKLEEVKSIINAVDSREATDA